MTQTVTPGAAAHSPGIPSADAAERLRYAKDVIAGRVAPAPMPPPPWLEERLKQIAEYHGRPMPRWMRADLLLQENYGGQTVLAFQPDDPGEIVVFAVGMESIGALLRGLVNEERERVVVRYVEPFAD